MLPANVKKMHMNRRIKFLSHVSLGEYLQWEGHPEDTFGGVNRQALPGVFFSCCRHYSATSEVSLFLSVLINKVVKD